MRVKKRKSRFGVMICMPRPSDKRIVDETAEYIRQETKISWIGLAKGGVYAEAPEYSRNEMVEEALQDNEVTHIFSLDADTVPPPDTILRLLRYDKDIIAGVYPLFVSGRKCWSFSLELPEGDPIQQPLEFYHKLPRKPFKVKALAGSTVLIRKKVFDLMQPWYKTEREIKREIKKIIMGHDFVFSNNARRCGFDLWVDPTIQCKHYNMVELNSVFTGE